MNPVNCPGVVAVSIGCLNIGGCVAASATATPYRHDSHPSLSSVAELHCGWGSKAQLPLLNGNGSFGVCCAMLEMRASGTSAGCDVARFFEYCRLADDIDICRYTGLCQCHYRWGDMLCTIRSMNRQRSVNWWRLAGSPLSTLRAGRGGLHSSAASAVSVSIATTTFVGVIRHLPMKHT